LTDCPCCNVLQGIAREFADKQDEMPVYLVRKPAVAIMRRRRAECRELLVRNLSQQRTPTIPSGGGGDGDAAETSAAAAPTKREGPCEAHDTGTDHNC